MINSTCLRGDGSARKQPESELVRNEKWYEARRMGGICPKKGSSVGGYVWAYTMQRLSFSRGIRNENGVVPWVEGPGHRFQLHVIKLFYNDSFQ